MKKLLLLILALILLCSCTRTLTGTVAWKNIVETNAQHLVALESGKIIEVTADVYDKVWPGNCYEFGQAQDAANFNTVKACD